MGAQKLRWQNLRVQRALIRAWAWVGLLCGGMAACSSLPRVEHRHFKFPSDRAFVGVPERAYEVLGRVRADARFPTLDPDASEERLCRNYYNQAVRKLVDVARSEAKADAVIEVRSVTVLLDGRKERHETAECADDGAEGEVLVEGIAVRWKPDPKPSGDATL